MLGIGALGLLLGVLPLFLWLDAHRSVPALILVMSILGVLVAGFTGVAPLVLAGMFRTGLRSTGISLAYNGAFVIFGGFAPAILTWFTTVARGSVIAPAWYVASAALPALAALGSLHWGEDHRGTAEAAKVALRKTP
jgi:MHS family proline/betaine transporter-like MFS transporter